MVWGIHLCWPEQARWLLKVLRVDLNSSKELCHAWCWAAVPDFHTCSLGCALGLAGFGRWVPQG